MNKLCIIPTTDLARAEAAIDLVDEIAADGVLAEIEIQDQPCIALFAQNAVMTVKCHSGQAAADQFTAVSVLRKGATQMEIIRGEEKTETLIDRVLMKDGCLRWDLVPTV